MWQFACIGNLATADDDGGEEFMVTVRGGKGQRWW